MAKHTASAAKRGPFFCATTKSINILKISALYFCSFELVSKRVGNNFKRVGTGTKARPEW